MNEKEFITNFIESHRANINPQLFQRDDVKIIDSLKDIILSCQRESPYFTIKVENFNVIEDYKEINNALEKYYNENGNKKASKNKKDSIYSYIDINQSAIRLLEVHYYIWAKGGSGNKDKNKEEDTFDTRLTVLIGVPRVVDKYYCMINGIKRSILYQIVDGSTYNNNTSSGKSTPCVTDKTIFMAVRLYRYFENLKTADGETVKCVNYIAHSFSKRVRAPKYIFAKYGYYGALEFFGIHCIAISRTAVHDPDFYSFKKTDGLFICVPKMLFDNDYVVQSICSMIYDAMVPAIPIEEYYSRNFWLSSLGYDFSSHGISRRRSIKKTVDVNDKQVAQDTLTKGLSILNSFQSIYDLLGKKVIRLPAEAKEDMYCILRWMLREYNSLRLKDNLDISIKRIRFAEYIASMYGIKIGKGILRVVNSSRSTPTCQSFIKALRTDPMFLVTSIARCRMVEYRNMTSDMDAFTALKFTFKGISGLGETNSKSIPYIYRHIHPSHVGRLDLDSSSDTDPGMKGIITPFIKIQEGGYFEDFQEPNEWESKFNELMAEWEKTSNLIEPMEFQSKVLGIDNAEQINIINEASYMAKDVLKKCIYEGMRGEAIPLEDLTDEEVFRVFSTGDGF